MENNLQNRIITPSSSKGDKIYDQNLRPKKLNDFIGQKNIKQNLSIFIQAAKARTEALDHVLLYGPPGLGKTCLAHIIAHEMNVNIHITAGPAIEKSGDIAAILSNLSEHDILFIDEIHRLNRVIEEVLYPAMEDFSLDIIIGKGPSAKTLRLDLPKFTLIGATTKMSLLSSPLRDRFGNIIHLNYYPQNDIKEIISRTAKILNIEIDQNACLLIAERARHTPRIANRLLKRIRDYAQIKGKGIINTYMANECLKMLQIDHAGLDNIDRVLLKTIINKFNGGPVGLNTLSAATGEELATIEDIYEPFLIQKGFIERTPRGRRATKSAYEHLNIVFKKNKTLIN
jgi:Holliday junction DNA helicase RuvB